MKTLKFTQKINAPKERVWDVLWGDDSYKAWTKPFSPDSNVKTDWQEGSSVWFTDGKESGMYGVINKNVPNEQMTFKHLGMLKDGKELPTDETTESWSGAIEDYQLKEQNGVTNLEVSVDTLDDHQDFFDDSFPKALGIVKDLSEKNNI